MVLLFIVLLVCSTLLAGWYQGGLRAALHLILWLPMFFLLLVMLYQMVEAKQFDTTTTMLALKYMGLSYVVITAMVWLVDRFVFKAVLVGHTTLSTERKIRLNRICGVAVAAAKVAVVIVCISGFGLMVNSGTAPNWVQNNPILKQPLPVLMPIKDYMVANGYLSFEHVYYDESADAEASSKFKGALGNFADNPFIKMRLNNQ